MKPRLGVLVRGAFFLLAAFALAGCLAVPDSPALRDIHAPISSQVDVTAERLSGDWVIRRSWIGDPHFAAGEADARMPDASRFRVMREDSGMRLAGRKFEIDRAGNAGFGGFDTGLAPSGPGRFRETGGKVFGGAELWVLWMDADDRTVAIGTPGGEFGWIMDRRASGGQDRLKAAGEIMAWMGYDMSKARGNVK